MIDLVLISNKKPSSKDKKNLIEIWVIDVTVSANEVEKKMIKFIKEFMKFSDRF